VRELAPSAVVEGVRWYWPEGEDPMSRKHRPDEQLRLLAPFDPIVWDRLRVQLLWDWTYRFEAYTPAPRRVLGYYALPMLWGAHLVGWGNVSVKDEQLVTSFGALPGVRLADAGLQRALDDELDRLHGFLGLGR
jgi:hypothetical protein